MARAAKANANHGARLDGTPRPLAASNAADTFGSAAERWREWQAIPYGPSAVRVRQPVPTVPAPGRRSDRPRP